MGEGHEGEFAKGVDALFRWGRGGRFGFGLGVISALHDVQVEFSSDVAGAGCKDDSDVSVGGLYTECGAQDAEKVEVGEVIDLPFLVDPVDGVLACAGWNGDAAAENDGVETSGWVIVDPFRGESADGV